MGVCQTVGGAATSGRGLTGRQVVAAIATTAEEQLKSHQRRLLEMGKDNQGINEDHHNITQTLKGISVHDYNEERVLRIDVPGADGMSKVVVHEYAPDVFRYLRHLAGVEEDAFTDEWALPEDRLSLELGEGRSMAMFIKSKTMRFMCKTIAKTEVSILLEILHKYTDYLARCPGSLLMRFLMLLRVECGNEVGYILCFGDVFSSCCELNEKWDIKGRIPKPGKYQHFPKLIERQYEPQPCIFEEPRKVLELPAFLDSHYKDSDIIKSQNKYKLITRKDKNLTRLFWLEKSVRDRLVDVLLSDYEFLENVGLMDYSLLIGVAYNKNKLSNSGKRIQSMKMTYEMGSSGAVEVRQSGTKKHFYELGFIKRKDSEGFMGGISSLYDEELYYIGVIDVLTHYTWKKKTAHFFKSFLWKSETLSTVSPRAYRERLSKYTKMIFPTVESNSKSATHGGGCH